MARFRRSPVPAATASGTILASLAVLVAPAAGADGVTVYPGMEIRQESTMCTLGYIDPVQRIAFSAGHCRGNGPVTDRTGRLVGMVTTARDNTPNGTVVRTD